jgi:hypothetical protein
LIDCPETLLGFAWFQSLQSVRLIGWPTFGPTSTWG